MDSLVTIMMEGPALEENASVVVYAAERVTNQKTGKLYPGTQWFVSIIYGLNNKTNTRVNFSILNATYQSCELPSKSNFISYPTWSYTISRA